MAMPFIRDLSHSLQGAAVLHTKYMELTGEDERNVYLTSIEVSEEPAGFQLTVETWVNSVGSSTRTAVDTEDLEELADMFAEAADISRSLS